MKILIVFGITLATGLFLIKIISLYFTFILLPIKKYSTKFTIEDGLKKSEFTEDELEKDKVDFSFVSRFGYIIKGQIFINNINKIVIFSHGVTWTLYGMYKYMIPFLQRDFTCVLIDSKGHGQSSGGFPAYGYYEKYDLYDCYQYLLSFLGSKFKDFNPSVGLFGESMGAAITLQALSLFTKNDRLDFCILESPFSDLERLCRLKLIKFFKTKFLANLVLEISRFFIKILAKFDIKKIKPIDDANNSNIPILLFHGENDNLVPFEMSKEIYEIRKNKSYTEFYIIKDADHTQGYMNEKEFYIDKIFTFIDKIVEKER